MAEELKIEQKTRTIGVLPAASAHRLAGWKEYKKASDEFAEAKKVAANCKTILREQIKKALVNSNKDGTITEETDLDFTVNSEGGLLVVENLLKKTQRQRGNVLSLT